MYSTSNATTPSPRPPTIMGVEIISSARPRALPGAAAASFPANCSASALSSPAPPRTGSAPGSRRCIATPSAARDRRSPSCPRAAAPGTEPSACTRADADIEANASARMPRLHHPRARNRCASGARACCAICVLVRSPGLRLRPCAPPAVACRVCAIQIWTFQTLALSSGWAICCLGEGRPVPTPDLRTAASAVGLSCRVGCRGRSSASQPGHQSRKAGGMNRESGMAGIDNALCSHHAEGRGGLSPAHLVPHRENKPMYVGRLDAAPGRPRTAV